MGSNIFKVSLLACALPISGCAAGSPDDVSGGERTGESTSALYICGAPGTTIGLLSNDGAYVTADIGRSNAPLLTEWNHFLQWERFYVVDAGGGWIALQSEANGLYVSTDLNNGGQLEAGWATTIQSWEKFAFVTVVDQFGDNLGVGLRSYANGLYVSANVPESGGPLQAAWATTIQAWELFQCVPYVNKR